MVDVPSNAQILIDNRGKVRCLNQLTEKLFKYADYEIIGKEIPVLIPFDHQPKNKKTLTLISQVCFRG